MVIITSSGERAGVGGWEGMEERNMYLYMYAHTKETSYIYMYPYMHMYMYSTLQKTVNQSTYMYRYWYVLYSSIMLGTCTVQVLLRQPRSDQDLLL